jgi:hypothetical protein
MRSKGDKRRGQGVEADCPQCGEQDVQRPLRHAQTVSQWRGGFWSGNFIYGCLGDSNLALRALLVERDLLSIRRDFGRRNFNLLIEKLLAVHGASLLCGFGQHGRVSVNPSIL